MDFALWYAAEVQQHLIMFWPLTQPCWIRVYPSAAVEYSQTGYVRNNSNLGMAGITILTELKCQCVFLL